MRMLIVMLVALLVGGCAGREGPKQETIEAKGKELASQSRSRIVDVVQEPYLGAVPVALPKHGEQAAVFGAQVTLRMRGTLEQLCAAVSGLVPLAVSAEKEIPTPTPAKKGGQGGRSNDMPVDLAAMLDSAGEIGVSAHTAEVDYSGPLRGLLDSIGHQFGMGWSYSAADASISFSRFQVRTFTLLSAPGTLKYSNQITNKSREALSGGTLGGSTGVRQTVSSGDSTTQTAQTNTSEISLDVWSEVDAGVKALLSKGGTAVAHQSSGSITVKDTPVVLQQVGAYIEDLNAKLSRQVALSVKVWSLELSDNTDAGLNLQVLFENADVLVTSGGSPLTFLQSGGDISAAIVDGKLKGSTALLKALRSFGKASQVTSGGGVVMSNTPVPVQATTKEAYLAGVNTYQSDYGQTTEITPGEVTTGFAMTVIPHILERRRVILQYNINLSSLDDMAEFATDDIKVQLPKVSSRSFSQRVTLKMGQTLVLAGFEQERDTAGNNVGLLGVGRSRQYARSIIVVTIEVESGDV